MRLVRLSILSCLLFAFAAHAGDAAKGRALFQKGEAALAAGKGTEALQAFRASYDETASPSLFYFIGEAYRINGFSDKAIANYKDYLARLPNGPHKADAEARIAELEGRKAPAKAAEAKPAAGATAKKKPLELGEIDLDAPVKKPTKAEAKKAAAEKAAAEKAAAVKAAEEKAAAEKAAAVKAAAEKAAAEKAAAEKAAAEKAAAEKAAAEKAAAEKAAAEKAAAEKAAAAKAAEAKAPPAPAKPAEPASEKASSEPTFGRGPKLTIAVSGGLVVMSHGRYYSPNTHQASDYETAGTVGISVETGYRWGAFSLGFLIEAFTTGSPELFGNDLAVPLTFGPRAQYALGNWNLGANVSWVAVPRQTWLTYNVATGVDVGYQFGRVGVRLGVQVLFGTSDYYSSATPTVLDNYQVVTTATRLGLTWDF